MSFKRDNASDKLLRDLSFREKFDTWLEKENEKKERKENDNFKVQWNFQVREREENVVLIFWKLFKFQKKKLY